MEELDNILPEYLPAVFYAKIVMGQRPAYAQVNRKFRNRPDKLIKAHVETKLPSGLIVNRHTETWVRLSPHERIIHPETRRRIHTIVNSKFFKDSPYCNLLIVDK